MGSDKPLDADEQRRFDSVMHRMDFRMTNARKRFFIENPDPLIAVGDGLYDSRFETEYRPLEAPDKYRMEDAIGAKQLRAGTVVLRLVGFPLEVDYAPHHEDRLMTAGFVHWRESDMPSFDDLTVRKRALRDSGGKVSLRARLLWFRQKCSLEEVDTACKLLGFGRLDPRTLVSFADRYPDELRRFQGIAVTGTSRRILKGTRYILPVPLIRLKRDRNGSDLGAEYAAVETDSPQDAVLGGDKMIFLVSEPAPSP